MSLLNGAQLQFIRGIQHKDKEVKYIIIRKNYFDLLPEIKKCLCSLTFRNGSWMRDYIFYCKEKENPYIDAYIAICPQTTKIYGWGICVLEKDSYQYFTEKRFKKSLMVYVAKDHRQKGIGTTIINNIMVNYKRKNFLGFGNASPGGKMMYKKILLSNKRLVVDFE